MNELYFTRAVGERENRGERQADRMNEEMNFILRGYLWGGGVERERECLCWVEEERARQTDRNRQTERDRDRETETGRMNK